MLSLFLIAIFGGILLTYVSFPPNTLSSLAQQAQMQTVGQSSSSFLLIFILEIAFIALVLFGLRNYIHRGKNVFSVLEAYIILFGSFFFFFFLLGNILVFLNLGELAFVALLCAFAIFFAKKRQEWNTQRFRNAITLISSVGAGVFIGVSIGAEFGVLVLYAVLGLFAIYDYLAVFVLKFMIPLARQASSMNLAFMIGSSEMEMRPPEGKKNKIKSDELKQIKSGYVKSLIREGNLPSVSSVMLGNGDIMLPLAVAVGSYAYTGEIIIAFVIAIGAAVGLIATFGVLRRYLIGLPAIPPIFAFVSVALALYSLATGFFGPWIPVLFVLAAVFSVGAMSVTIRSQVRKKV